MENGNECEAGSLSILDEEECIAAAEAMELSFLSTYDVQSNPKGCHLLPGTGVYFNSNDVGMAHWGFTPICKSTFIRLDFKNFRIVHHEILLS